MIEAELIIGLADRFHCTPQEAEEMDAGYIRMLKVYDMGREPDDGE